MAELLYCVTCGNPIEASSTSPVLRAGCANCGGKAFVSEKPSIFLKETPAEPAPGVEKAEKGGRAYDYRKAAFSGE